MSDSDLGATQNSLVREWGRLGLAGALDTHPYSLPQESWNHLLASSKYNEQESFVVVFQPFFYETLPLVSESCHEEPRPSSPSHPHLHRSPGRAGLPQA